MNTVVTEGTKPTLRPSRLVAEALVNGHDAQDVKRRAKAMGLPTALVDTLVSVCCGYQTRRPAADGLPRS